MVATTPVQRANTGRESASSGAAALTRTCIQAGAFRRPCHLLAAVRADAATRPCGQLSFTPKLFAVSFAVQRAMKHSFSATPAVRAALVAAAGLAAFGLSATAAGAQPAKMPSYASSEEVIRGRIA